MAPPPDRNPQTGNSLFHRWAKQLSHNRHLLSKFGHANRKQHVSACFFELRVRCFRADGFIGCVRGIRVNNKLLALEEDVVESGKRINFLWVMYCWENNLTFFDQFFWRKQKFIRLWCLGAIWKDGRWLDALLLCLEAIVYDLVDLVKRWDVTNLCFLMKTWRIFWSPIFLSSQPNHIQWPPNASTRPLITYRLFRLLPNIIGNE
jgi:hypothetical protein